MIELCGLDTDQPSHGRLWWKWLSLLPRMTG